MMPSTVSPIFIIAPVSLTLFWAARLVWALRQPAEWVPPRRMMWPFPSTRAWVIFGHVLAVVVGVAWIAAFVVLQG
jgi:hypothetical protein